MSFRHPHLTIVECPRDAWQGVSAIIPTSTKSAYIQALIGAGFDTIDMGSFVSPKAVPQVSDTAAVLESLDIGRSRLLVIVANVKGAEAACREEKVSYIGYPFSVSETFQLKNTNATIPESFEKVKDIRELCVQSGKELVIYISMGFGNPYGDPWNADLTTCWVERLSSLGIRIFSLADTVGLARPVDIAALFSTLSTTYPALLLGAHFHSRPDAWLEKVATAYENGCRRFDGTLSGFGGCPFAQDELVGNIATENLLEFAAQHGADTGINLHGLEIARNIFTEKIAPYY